MTDHKTYDSIIAAKYLMALACSKGQCLNTTKVQKLLYIAYGYALAHYGYRIVSESPQAWPFGPVFARTQKKVDYSIEYSKSDEDFEEIRDDKEINALFNEIIDKYSGFSAKKLSDWSHIEDSPWHKTTMTHDFKWSKQIPDEYIKDYFINLSL